MPSHNLRVSNADDYVKTNHASRINALNAHNDIVDAPLPCRPTGGSPFGSDASSKKPQSTGLSRLDMVGGSMTSGSTELLEWLDGWLAHSIKSLACSGHLLGVRNGSLLYEYK